MIESRKSADLSKVFSQVKKASLEALQLSRPQSKQLLRNWSELLRDLGLPKQERARLAAHNLTSLLKNLQTLDFQVFRKGILSLGESLARQQVDIHDGIVMIESLSEDYLSVLQVNGPGDQGPSEDQLRRMELALAVGRLSFFAARILAAGYSHQLEEDRRMSTSRNRRSEEILHGTSSILTRFYERERYKISRQLQDKLGDHLVGLKLHLDSLTRANVEGSTEQCSVQLEKSAALLDEAIRSVRRMVLDLGPAVVRDVGLIPAIRMYVRQFSSRSWIDVTIEAENFPAEIPTVLQVALYRLSQQVLDFCRLSRAKNIKMSFKEKKGAIVIVVERDEVPVQVPRKRLEESWLILCNRVSLLGAVLHRRYKDVGPRIEILVPPTSPPRTATVELDKFGIAAKPSISKAQSAQAASVKVH
ncbi:MAG: histidine kinase [Acidobacteriota bacterium]